MSPLRAETRALIRHLYFVRRRSLREIADMLGLSPRSVRSALVIAGGVERRDGPPPAASHHVQAGFARAVTAPSTGAVPVLAARATAHRAPRRHQ